MKLEDYGLISDLQTAALVGRDGSIDWLCLPRFDSDSCFASLLGDEWDGRWLLAPDCDVIHAERRYREGTLVHELDFHCESGVVRVIDFMPPRGEDPDVVRIVEGIEGSVPIRMELVIRFGYGAIVPWVRRLDDDLRVAIAGPDALTLRTTTPVRGENLRTVSEFTVEAGERASFVLTWFPSHHVHNDLPDPVDPEQALEETCSFWREWLENCTYEGSLAGARAALADDPEGAHLPADRRHRGGPDDVSAGADRRHAELGLPLLLAARRDVRARRAARMRLPRRGGGVEGLALAGSCRRPGRPPDHVRRGRRAAPDRVRDPLAQRLRELTARPRRQQRQHAVPTRRLRRGPGRAPPGAPARDRAGRPVVVDPASHAREPRAALARARRGNLGGARAAPSLHTLQGDGVGRIRPGRQGCRGVRPRRSRRPLARAFATRSMRRCSSAATTRSSARSLGTTTGSESTRAC